MSKTDPDAPDKDISRYADVLKQIQVRGAIVSQLLAGNPTYPDAESAALQMRMTLELIPMLGLLAHRELIEKIASAYQRKDPQEAAKLVKQVNADYWPRPVVQIPTPGGPTRDRLEAITDGFVREEEWQADWGWLSSLLHARNPYKGDPDLTPTWERLKSLHQRIVRLLNTHETHLPGGKQFVLGQIVAHDGESHAYIFALHQGELPPPRS